MNLRVDPRVKAVAECAAERDHRSLTSFVEVLILDHCNKIGIQFDPKSQPQKESKND